MIRLIFVIVMAFSLHAKQVVVITGASKGVGLATAELLAKRGFTVYGTTRNAPPQVETDVHFLPVDLLDETSIREAIQTVIENEGQIDVLINNAGYALAGPVEWLAQEEIQEQMEVNFFAPIRCIQAVLPLMRAQKSGQIINISSTNAYLTPPFGSLYAASKAALESLSEALAIEVRPYNISVSVVEPGLLSTHFALPIGTRKIAPDPYQAKMDEIKLEIENRLANPELLFPSQSPQEIAEFLFGIIQDPHPKLRYQTSEEAKNEVAKKLLDLTGENYLRESGGG